MATFKAYLKKEIIEAVRHYKYILLAAVVIFFAVLDPIMMKILPSIIKNQSSMDLSALMPSTRAQLLQSYIKDMFQMVNIAIVFLVSGSISSEVYGGKLIFPYSNNLKMPGLVLAKAVHYIIAVCIAVFIGFFINYYYVNLLYTKGSVSFSHVMYSAFLVVVFFSFNICLTLLLSSIFKKEIIPGIIVIFLSYFSFIFSIGFKSLYNLLPVKLIDTASKFGTGLPNKLAALIIISEIVFLILTIIKLENTSVTR